MSNTSLRFLDEKLEIEKDYWLQKLSGNLTVSGVPLDSKRPALYNDEKQSVNIHITPDIESKLLKFCNDNESLAFTVAVTALKICLHKYSAAEDIIVGTTIHERYAEMASLNKVLALRDQVSGAMTVKQLLLEVKATLSEAYSHQKYPFDSVLNLLQAEHPENHAALFNVVIVLDNANSRKNVSQLKNDVTLAFSITPKSINGTIEYNASLFKKESIELFGEHFKHILRTMLDGPEVLISRLELLSEDKKRELTSDFNATSADYPKHKTIHQLFEEQVAATPEAVAVVLEEQQLTYRELNSRANQLAHHLERFQVGPGVKVGIYMEHSMEMVVAVFGILKAGGAYVPLDPSHPSGRLPFMLQDAEVQIVLTQRRYAANVPADVKTISLDAEWNLVELEGVENAAGGATAESLAYLIYTSGSTGEPKGVKINHSALVNYIWWARDVYLHDETLAFPLYSSLAFDLTVTSIYTPLITGNKIIVYQKEGRESPLAQILKDNQVGVLKLTPSHLSLIKDQDNSKSRIKRLIVGGEAFDNELASQIHLRFGGDVEIFNEYGPTEATVGCMLYKFVAGKELRAFVPIGKPAANTQIYVLDSGLNPVAENVIGELFIAGDCLAQGYHNRDELTRERFVANPFNAGAKMYKSGDLARWLPEGILEFVGRRDDQIKFHGYRVELNELRSSLNRHPKVRNSVIVVARDLKGNDAIVAYYVARQEIEVAELRAFMQETIIEETIPNLFMHMNRLPLTINGKVNYQALPTIEEIREKIKREFVAARTPSEEMLAGIWAEVLGLKQVSIHENFFELGGHSLLATQIISRVRDLLHVDLPLRVMFESPTVANLAEKIEAGMRADQNTQLPAIMSIPYDAHPPLSFPQQRLWFLEQLNPGQPIYNIFAAASLTGPLDVAVLEQSLSEMIRRHESLRTTFAMVEREPVQIIAPAMPFTLSVVDLREFEEKEREAETQRRVKEDASKPFDLSSGPLLRTSLLRMSEQEYVVLLTMHHIISDGWSLDIFLSEMVVLYSAFSLGRPSPLPALRIQYSDFALWQRRWLRGDVLVSHLSYWRRQLADAPPVLKLPTDRVRPPIQSFRGTKQLFALPTEVAEGLDSLSRHQGVTLYMTLLAAFKMLLYHYAAEEDIIVGANIANRNRTEIEGLIGFFTNMLVMRTKLSGDPTFRELLGRVRESALGAYTHQDVPFEKVVEELQPERDLDRTPLVQVVFTFQPTPPAGVEFPGLKLKALEQHNNTTRFDLILNLVRTKQGLGGSIIYSIDLFNASTIARMIDSFQLILREVTAEPEIRLSQLAEKLTEANRQQQISKRKEFKQTRERMLEKVRPSSFPNSIPKEQAVT
jgi:amino acid adenylation domain-containing protein